MKSYEELLSDLKHKSISTMDLRTLNRKYMHPNNKRACNECFIVFEGIRENFHIKKYDKGSVFYNVKCKQCFLDKNRKRLQGYRENPEQIIKAKVAGYKNRALEKNVKFDLTAEYLIGLWNSQKGLCFYSGLKMDFSLKTQSSNYPHLLQPSVDRMDPDRGYTQGNVVWCSYALNRMKNDLTYDEFIKAAQVILKLHEERQRT